FSMAGACNWGQRWQAKPAAIPFTGATNRAMVTATTPHSGTTRCFIKERYPPVVKMSCQSWVVMFPTDLVPTAFTRHRATRNRGRSSKTYWQPLGTAANWQTVFHYHHG